MSTEILVNAASYETRVVIVEHGLPQEIYIERPRRRGLVGNIYKGRVVRVLPGMQAAFVDIGGERTAFLHANDTGKPPCAEPETNGGEPPAIQRVLAEGETVLVQVFKDPLGSKGARVTMRISLPSRYLAYVPGAEGVAVSARIEDPHERDRLRHVIERTLPPSPGGGFIARTAAEDASEEALQADMRYLARLWALLEAAALEAAPASLVHEDLPLPLRVMRDLLDREVEQMRVDSEEVCAQARRFAGMFLPEFAERIRHYEGERPIFDLYGVEDEITRALARRVDLKSGGYLIFDQTEAMTTIDVNSGTYTGSRNFEETVIKINLEAAQAIARQLRLRNLGGVIIIDFIDMKKSGHQVLVLETLRRELAADRMRSVITGISEFGLVAMTRKRTRESLEHVLTEPCAACRARGTVKTAESLCFDIYRELERLAGQFIANEYLVLGPANVIELLLDEESSNLAELAARLDHPVRLQTESHYGPEQFDVIPL